MSCNALMGSVKFVFVTVNGYDGDLGGVAGANAICQSEAAASGLPGTYRAWLSDNLGNSPSTTFTQSPVPDVNTDAAGSQVAANWTALITNGATNITARGGGSFTVDYTHDTTAKNGTPYSAEVAETYSCTNWTTDAPASAGEIGTPGQVGAPIPYDEACSASDDALTCFQQ